MINIVTEEKAVAALKENGIDVSSISIINEGANHFVFQVILLDGKKAICKFTKIRETENNQEGMHRDTLLGGLLSLEREAYLFKMIREKTGVPTPKLYGIHYSRYGKFILIEWMKGESHKACMANSGYSASVFLNSMYELGKDFAHVHQVTFKSYGNIMDKGTIEPEGITNFADRFLPIIERRLKKCAIKGVFSNEDQAKVELFFKQRLKVLRPLLDLKAAPPTLVFTDMHAENFFTDNLGKPTAYFDLESSQAAPAALEFYGFRFFLFNFYDEEFFEKAENAFFQGYAEQHGPFIPSCKEDLEVIDFLSSCRLLELSESYWGWVDGIRDNWGKEMKKILFYYIDTGLLDYMSVGNIWRQRDKQPCHPLKE